MIATFARRGPAAALAAISLLIFPGLASAQQARPNAFLRGQVTAFDGGALTIRTLDGGSVTVHVPGRTRVSSLTRVAFSELKKGDFIASAGRRQADGTLKAIDVRIFPSGGRHPPEVHRKFRLGPESTMTNAWVDGFVGGATGQAFRVKYKDGEKTIMVTEEALVMRQNPGTQALLKPGANVSVVGRKGKDGRIEAVRIAVGMNGLVPPT